MMPITDQFDVKSGPRILILSASVGAGHIRAAQAIESALSTMLPDATIAHLDALDLTNPAFRRAYGKGYFRAAQRAPRFVGWMYDFLDHPNDHGATTITRQFFERLNFTKLSRLLTDQPWDLAICTHFLPAALIARLRRKEEIHYPHAVVVTDFDVHGMWVSRPCERFFVATDEAKANLASQDIDPRDIAVTGIPIDPIFAEHLDRQEAAAHLGLNLSPSPCTQGEGRGEGSPRISPAPGIPGEGRGGGFRAEDIRRPTILQLAGGFGVGSIERIHRAICQIERPLQIVVVTGRNTEAAQALAHIDHDPRHTRKILGFTTQMHELYSAADIVVTKPGGLTSAECLASGLPMLISEPIPGQEDRNADYLLENGCAIKVNNLASLTHKLTALLDDPARLNRMRTSALAKSRPQAAFDVAKGCIQLLNQHSMVV